MILSTTNTRIVEMGFKVFGKILIGSFISFNFLRLQNKQICTAFWFDKRVSACYENVKIFFLRVLCIFLFSFLCF